MHIRADSEPLLKNRSVRGVARGLRALYSKKGQRLFIILSIFTAFYLPGCATTGGGKGVIHTVGEGETLWRISRTYGVNVQDLAEINNIKDPREIEAGRKLFIPGASRVRKVRPRTSLQHNEKRQEETKRAAEEEHEEKIVVEKDRFSWPVKGEIISPFGVRNGVRHDGIDIKAGHGAPVKAAGDGKAVYVNSSMRGYGNIVILKHKDGFYTVYAHNKENLVKTGETVSKGDTIARVGSSGNASVDHLHFEVRQGKKARNPLFFLP